MSSHNKISRADIYHVAIPFIKPFETSFGVITTRPFLIIRIEDSDGNVGFGEASLLLTPLSEKEILADGIVALKDTLPSILTSSLDTIDEIDIALSSLAEFPITRTGIEGALLDLYAHQNHISLRDIFYGTRTSIELGESVGIKPTIEEVCEEVTSYIQQGFSRIKIKIKPGFDTEVIDIVRKQFPSINLATDANAAYLPEHIPLLASLEKYNLMFIEQPFATDDLSSHSTLAKKMLTPICLDESVYDLPSCINAINTEACDMINIKPARVGGYLSARRIHNYCYERGIPLFGGGRLESGIGRIFNAHLFSLPGFTLPSDMSATSQYFTEDLIDPPFEPKKGVFSIPQGEGLGITILEERIKRHCVEHLSFENKI